MVYGPIFDCDLWNFGDLYSKAMNQKSDFYPYDVEMESNPETKKPVKYFIKVALAGISKDDISTSLNDDGLLEIVVTPKTEEKANVKVLRKNISYAKKSITFDVPKEIDVKNITVKYIDGLLIIELPLIIEKSKRRSIKIG